MAVENVGARLKFRLKYEKGSQTFSNCDPLVEDQELFDVGQVIGDLRKDEEIEMTKIVESNLIETF